MSDWKAYELGIADVIRHKVGAAASVEYDVRLPGRTGRARRVDIVVRGNVFGLTDALFVVECKHRSRPVDVGLIDGFNGLVEDVGADLGLLVTASGTTRTAKARADQKRLRVRVISRAELDQWSPPGTRAVMLTVPATEEAAARKALLDAGYRVRNASGDTAAGEARLEAYRLADTDFSQQALRALTEAGINARSTGSAVTITGGTPAHRWIPVYLPGQSSPIRVMAATLDDLRREVEGLAGELGVPPTALEARPPEGWPVADTF